MKQFFKFMFASFVGTLLTLLLLLFIAIGTISALVSMAENEQVKLKENTVLVAKFDNPILDRSPNNPFENFDFMQFKPNQVLGLNDVLKNIEKAAADPNIKGIYLDLSDLKAGMASIQEIRQKLMQFKASEKFIVAYSEGYSQGAYYLASVADEIYLNPEGMVMFKGLMSQIAFLKGTLEKLEVEAQIIRGPDNKFKSAVEPLMYDKMSEANREQMETLLHSAWNEMVTGISQSRNISVAELHRIANELALNNAESALELRFVDQLVYKDEMLDILRKKLGTEEDDKIQSVGLAKYTNAKVGDETMSRNKLAVIYAIGEIGGGEGSESTIGSEGISRAIRKAREDDKVKAIVMRVNSPGGSALASEVIRREVELAKAEKPFIVSMGDVAASGGYWISTNADYIFAEPNTITGSIGVFGVIPYLGKMFENKLGMTFDKAMTNTNADFIDVMEPLGDFQRKKIQDEVVAIYHDFTNLVADTRNLTQSYVDSVGQGRVWTGTDALNIGLVDALGGLEDAIQMAAEKAGIADDYRLYALPEQKDPFQQIIAGMTGEARAKSLLKKEFGTYYAYLEYVEKMSNMKGVQARLPFYFTIE
ncbi:MAG: signal peptide peptidase SppA [Bacteroidetes bacterium]|nr:signal peptide peptidase SppA [Bacteroidota bacterium]MBU1580746.1 signal peptide peptidase SppA [Bacteroidota bacterium]MBU2465718.1 signal peptide peptidase SppA [Bacteroidota bacterium]MBU2558522.1 signal peptide peptidase SppA [Bacteroidota bacterium]